MKKNQRLKLILILSIFFCVTYTFLLFLNLLQFNNVSKDSVKLVKSHKIPTILLWNIYWGNKRWYLPNDTLLPIDFKEKLHCPVYQCQLSNNHSFLPSIDMYDAILFHTAHEFSFPASLASKRHPKQLYVFAQKEPPVNSPYNFEDKLSFYNLTMTYRLDSDILWPYSSVSDITTGAIIAPAKFPNWKLPPASYHDSKIKNLWSSKTKGAAWFVSHCHTEIKREKLVEALQQYISVDVFGECGPKSCPRKSTICDEMLDSTYIFYLAFENSLCTDYVTEKLYYNLKRFVIPVVLGGADYNRFAPPHSYIDAESFDNVAALGQYLNYVASNATEYMSYFWWRQYYQVVFVRAEFCDLCAKLNNPIYGEKTTIYNNIERWWKSGSCNHKPKIKF